MARIAINGFGRIGRSFLRASYSNNEFEIVAINDLGDLENLAYLLKYDSAYGKFKGEIGFDKEKKLLLVDGKEISFISEKNPTNLPWKELGIDIVVESSGAFASFEKSRAHIDAGAKRVVITAPVKDEGGETVLMGINEDDLSKCDISSNASCTTNAGSPIISILNEKIGIEKAILNTVHAYTASQKLVDSPEGKDLRGGRAAAVNMIPATTGAAIATAKVIKELEGKFDGVAIRVPVLTGSLADITFIASRDTSVDEINAILREAAQDKKWAGLFTTTDEPIVSSDIVGEAHASVADLSFTKVVDGNLVKVLAWYDNEMGYVHSLIRHVIKAAEHIK